MKKDENYYLNLNWTYEIEREDDYFILRVKELPGICTDGATIEEAMVGIREAIAAAVEMYQKFNEPVPEPIAG